MSSNEQQNQDSNKHFDQMMKEIKQVDPEILYSLVPGSKLHAYINNPVTKTTNKG